MDDSLSSAEEDEHPSTNPLETPEGEMDIQEDLSSSCEPLPPITALPSASTPRPTQKQGATPPPAAPASAKPPGPRTAAAVLAAAPTPKPKPTPTTTPAATTSTAKKQPVFVVDRLENWTAHFKELAAKLGHAPSGRPYGKGFRFMPKDDQEFRVIQAYLDSLGQEKAPYYAIAPANQRPLKVAIRGLPADTPAEEIVTDLTDKGVPVKYAKHIRARTGRPGCIFFAEVEKSPAAAQAAYAVNEVLLMPGVVVEAWRGKKGPSQCHRCQGFRHSSQNCHRPLACVRCGGGHHAHECPRPKEQPPSCANCKGQHTASNPACPVYKRETRSRRMGSTAPKTGPAQLVAHPNTVGESAPASLMAEANAPAGKGATKRPKKPRRKKKKQPALDPPPATKAGGTAATTTTTAASIDAERQQLAALLSLFAQRVRAGEIDTTGMLQSIPLNG